MHALEQPPASSRPWNLRAQIGKVPADAPRVLVVDAQPSIHCALASALTVAGFAHVEAITGRQGLLEIASNPPDAVVLDLALPDSDGHDVLKEARRFYACPIVILSARSAEADKIKALDAGADDFVEKPFHLGELLARVRLAIRHRSRVPPRAPVQIGDVILDLERRSITRSGQHIHLSPKEYDLLVSLSQHGGKVITHMALLKSLWGSAQTTNRPNLRMLVAHLRARIEAEPASPRLVLTVPGVGYRLLHVDSVRLAA